MGSNASPRGISSCCHETIEVMKLDGKPEGFSKGIFDEEGQAMSRSTPTTDLICGFGTEVEVYDILRRRKEAINFKIAFFQYGYIRAVQLCYFFCVSPVRRKGHSAA